MSVVVAPESSAEVPAVRRVVRAAFGDDGDRVAGLLDALRDSSAFVPGLSLVARERDDVVGHTLLTRAWLDAPDRLVEVLVLSPLAVAPHAQRRGVGTALLVAARTHGSTAGWPLLFLEGDPRFYSTRGFAAAGPLGFSSPSERIPAPAFQVAVLPTHEPWMTGRLVYPDPFWASDCVGLR
ncbi:GNAT family N-acetyltransferase [Cellulomonas gelida]|uniref:GNAT family N-acetyltransferase n=1 Tax=Cellulomonas gelida TaxID=1712 RepID=UPI00114490C1|nr:N-acetyltransferase [Cellulomonas gelida]